MVQFIVIDTGPDKLVDLFDEEDFIDEYQAEPISREDCPDDVDRITDLVSDCSLEVAWSRQDAVNIVIENINLLSIDEGDDSEELIGYAKMLIKIGESDWWDTIIEKQF